MQANPTSENWFPKENNNSTLSYEIISDKLARQMLYSAAHSSPHQAGKKPGKHIFRKALSVAHLSRAKLRDKAENINFRD